MTLSGNKPPGMFPPKLAFMASDISKSNKLYGFRLNPPTNFFAAARKSCFIQHILLAVKELCLGQALIFKLVEVFTQLYLSEPSLRDKQNNLLIGKSDEGMTSELEEIIKRGLKICKIEGQQLRTVLKTASSSMIQDRLKENNKNCVERGVFGAPTMFVSDVKNGVEEFMVFGSDRFEQIAHICKKPYYGVNLQLKKANI